MSINQLSYQLIDPTRDEEALAFSYDHYFINEPMGKATLDSPQEKTPILDTILTNCLKSNDLSMCAIDESSGKMAGLLLSHSCDVDTLPDSQETHDDYVASGIQPKHAPIFVIVDKALDHKQLLIDQKHKKMVYMLLLCVHGDYGQRGIATELVKRTMDHAISKHGYSMFSVVCTGYYSQRVYEKLGFQKHKEIKYADYTVDGEVVFRNVEPPHKSTISYYKIV